MNEDEHKQRLLAAYRRHYDPQCELVSFRTLTGGASATTTLIELQIGGEKRKSILRCASTRQGQDGFALLVDKEIEARVQAAAHQHGVRCAPVQFILDEGDGLGAGYAMDFIAGEAHPAKLLSDATLRAKLSTDVGEVLARIHAVPLETLPKLAHEAPATQLSKLRDAYDSFSAPSPTFEVAFRCLAEHSPRERPTTLVHGDFRTGNLLANASGVAAVLDWELCHLGSPIEDLGWCCVAAWRFGRLGDRVGGFGSVEAVRDSYLAHGGTPFSDEELTYWEVFGTLRWGVICLYQVFAHLRGEIPSIERAAIGRRVSEVEIDLVRLLTRG